MLPSRFVADLNRDTRAAWRYHDGTKHSYESIRRDRHFLDWSNQPLAFKTYTTLDPISLPKTFAPSPGSALAAIAGTEGAPATEHVPDLETLARLFYFSSGVTRVRNTPGGQILFRAAASTGALYHVELYLACGDLPGVSAGLYHFSPIDFALRKLRDGDFRGVLVDASGAEPSIVSAPAVVLFTSTFWRNSWKYQARAYRHSFWDSGTLLANLLAVAAARNLSARLVLGFADAPVNRLLDVNPEKEVALGLVALGRSVAPPLPAPKLEPLLLQEAPLSFAEVDYPAILEMHAASCLEAGEEARAWRATPGEPLNPCDLTFPEPSARAQGERERVPERAWGWGPTNQWKDPIEEVIRRRGSTRRFSGASITEEELMTSLCCATRGNPADYGSALTTPYVIVNAVEGLPAGAYVYHPEENALEELKRGDFRREAGGLALGQELGAEASVNVYMMVDLAPVLARFGNRGYRAAQIDGGILGGKLYLGAYAERLGATGLTFYDDDVTRFFSPHAAGKSVMFLCALGRPAKKSI